MRFWPTKKWKQALLILFIAVIVAVPVAFTYLSYVNRDPAFKNGASPSNLVISSPAFEDGGAIPAKYTVQGENVNPPLNITGIPEGTQSIVVIVSDPIVPNVYSWTHWIAWNLPADQNIAEDTSAGVQGKNSWNRNGYGGPDPMGTRTYYFIVYALDDIINLSADSGQSALLRAMDNHVLAKAQITGTFAK